MPWFVCGDCGDTIKKVSMVGCVHVGVGSGREAGRGCPPTLPRRLATPNSSRSPLPSYPQPKIQAHTRTCSASLLTCVDCSRDFDVRSVGAHVSCGTEHDKYARGATKPGGHAAGGFYGDEGGDGGGGPRGGQVSAAANSDGNVVGARHLATRPPWVCALCNVTTTSRDTLLGHAAGAKHVRRARAVDRGAKKAAGAQAEAETTPAAAADDQAADDQKPAAAATVETPATPPEKWGSKKRAPTSTPKPPRWKKLAATALKSAPKRKLSEDALVAAVAQAAGVSVEAVEAEVGAWRTSSKFAVKKCKVKLVKEA